MFDEPQTNQTQSSNPAGSPAPTLGINPNPIFGGGPAPAQPAGPPVPNVVLPTSPLQSNNSQDDHDEPSDHTDHPGLNAPLNEDLDQMKKDALAQLSPLVSKLDQTPEEKFKTLMMMIQASDNQDLLAEAYDAAQKISDDKVKAEALLNIVNEINYFAQKG